MPRLGIVPSICDRLWASVEASLSGTIQASIEADVSKGVSTSVWASVQTQVWDQVWDQVGDRVWANLQVSVEARLRASIEASVKAYLSAFQLALYRFFDVYLAPNALHALAHFNELVSGYWLGAEQAIIVRRPNVLARDQEGRLHHATGKCVEYHDGWGLYAWHGIPVSEKVILTPEELTREDFVREPNLEVRRVIQERMGPRFVSMLGGQLIDEGPHGTLYEVALSGDPEGVARYVQVQDATAARQYVLRVPPWIQTATEAVAWSFQMAVEEYHPAQET